LQVEGAKDIAVEFFSLSKSYNMPGWRVGFMVGNPTLVGALAKIKSQEFLPKQTWWLWVVSPPNQ
jgi:alanine-synthesizing transaminase